MRMQVGKGEIMNFPSVTSVISPWVDFSHVPPDRLELASERGTRVHTACAAFAMGFPPGGLQEGDRGYLQSYERWFFATVKKVILVEERLVHTALGYHGQIDLFVEAYSGEFLLPDLKTPLAKSKGWRVQMAGYRELCIVNGYKVDRVGSLRLSPEGKPPKMDWYEEGAQDFTVFLSCLNATRFFSTNKY
jgi:hypothetical protein